MISESHKFIFVHITKTAGVSIRSALRSCASPYPKGLWETKPVHSQYKEYARAVDISKYYVFACVRNPWTRLVSLYCYWRAGTGAHPHNHGIDALTRKVSFRNWVSYISKLTDGESPIDYRHIRNQCEWLEGEGGQINLDRIIRFEELPKGFAQVCADLNLHKKLPHKNNTKHKDYRTYYNSKTRDTVARMFSRDIRQFGYTFD